MPKTAPKKAKTVRKVAATKTRSITRKPAAPATATSGSYHHQRDQFFITHPNARVLLAIFILAVAIYIGVMLWGQVTLYSAEVNTPGAVPATF